MALGHLADTDVVQTMRRVKANDKISFPATLDMGPLLVGESSAGEQAQTSAVPPEEQRFDLAAILVHKGGSATQGHYGEHVDERLGSLHGNCRSA